MNTLSSALIIPARILSVAGLAFFLVVVIKRWQPATFRKIFFTLLCSFYLVSKVCQAWTIGPPIIRWYFANIGAIPLSAWVLAVVTRRCDENILRLGAKIGLWVAVITELAQVVFADIYLSTPLLAHRRWDIVDLAIYPVAYIITIYLVRENKERWHG